MFSSKECEFTGCSRITLVDEKYCFTHLDNKKQFTDRIFNYIKESETIKNLNIAGTRFENIKITGKNFFSCNFSNVVFENISFKDCYVRQCFFDFAVFKNCIFDETNIKHSCFAGSVFDNCSFEMSDILHTNFNGIKCTKTVFIESDLYFSSFIKADLKDTLYDDCNLRKVNFQFSENLHVKFKNSNQEDAYFSQRIKFLQE